MEKTKKKHSLYSSTPKINGVADENSNLSSEFVLGYFLL